MHCILTYCKACTYHCAQFDCQGVACSGWQGSAVRGGEADSRNSSPEWKQSGSSGFQWKQSGSSGFHAGVKRRCRHPHQRFDHLLPKRPNPPCAPTFQHDKVCTFGLIMVLSSISIVASELEQQDSTDLTKGQRLDTFQKINDVKRHLLSMISTQNKSSPGIHD